MSSEKIPPCLAAAVMSLAARGECRDWADFAMVGRYNAMRHLRRRGWIEDAAAQARAAYEGDAPAWNVHPPRWRLTEAGKAIAEQLR